MSGSTPKRVARRFAELEVDDFIDGADASEAKYGLTSPRVRVTLKDSADGIRVVSLGAKDPRTVIRREQRGPLLRVY